MKLQPIFSEPKSSVPIGTKRSGDQPCLTPPVRAPKSSGGHSWPFEKINVNLLEIKEYMCYFFLHPPTLVIMLQR